MSVPVRVDGRELSTTPTIGVSLYPRDGEEADDLIRNADIAMYRAKARGRNTFQLYTPDMNAVAAERLQLQGELRNAHLRGEITLHYQPQIDVTDGHVVGCEALMRWKHPALGMVSPGRFIPLAEESGLIITLGNWAIREACRRHGLAVCRPAAGDGGGQPVGLPVPAVQLYRRSGRCTGRYRPVAPVLQS